MNELNNENFHKEIDLIQSCINRMASNSFLVKGWALSLIAVILAFIDKDISPLYLCFIVLIPLIGFWYLDGFFLYTEKLYRELYNWVVSERPKGNDALMYDLNPHRFKNILIVKKKGVATNKLETIFTVMWSTTLRWFYGIQLFIIVALMAYLFFCGGHKQEKVSKMEIVNTVSTKIPTIKLSLDSLPKSLNLLQHNGKIETEKEQGK